MNKKDIVSIVATQNEITKGLAADIFDSIFDAIFDGIMDKEKVSIPSFGVFEAKEVPERTCRNPQTGENIVVPAHYTPKFKFSSVVKKELKA